MATSAPAACASGNGSYENIERHEQRGKNARTGDRPDHRKQQETQRHHIMRELRQHQAQEIQRHHRVEFALAMQARAERVRNFHDAQIAARGGDDIEQDLEALRRKLRRQCSKRSLRIMKKPLMGSAIFDPQHAFCNLGSQRTGAGALLIEAVGAAAFDIAAAGPQASASPPCSSASILASCVSSCCRSASITAAYGALEAQDALDAGAGQAAPPDPPDAANAGIRPRQARTTSRFRQGNCHRRR